MASYVAPEGAAKKLLEHIKKHGKDRSWAELTKLYAPNANQDWSRTIMRSNGWNTTTQQFGLDEKVKWTKHHEENRKHKTENGELIKKIIELEKDISLLSRIKEHDPSRYEIPPPKPKKKNEATAIIQWSDWHCDEVVEFETTNGLNEFNKEIAKRRVFKLAENTVKLLDSQRSAVDIDNVVLHLGGDAIGGYIHPELQQTNSMSPLQGIFYAKDLIVAAIEYIMLTGNIKNLIVVTSRGNHPRLTPKMQYANDYSMNLETFLYWSLADYFKNDKRIVFKVEQSELSYLTVYDKVLRFFHGHQIRFQGGIGGLTVPLYKAIHRWNSNIKAYYNFMCDKHTYSTPTPDCQCNGCFIAGSKVTLKGGIQKNIEDVVVGDMVLSKDGNFNRVLNVMPQSPNSDFLICFTPNLNYRRAVRCTPNHEIWAIKGHNLPHSKGSLSPSFRTTETELPKSGSWIESKYLSVGDYVRVSSYNTGSDFLDKDFCRMLGFYLSEGSVHQKDGHNALRFTFHIEEKEYADFVQNKLKSMYPDKKISQIERPEKTTRDVYVYDKDICNLFVKYGGKSCYNKKINEELVNSLSKDCLLEILVGWLQGDGHAVKTGGSLTDESAAINGTTVSHSLASQLYLISNSIGLAAHMTNQPKSESERQNRTSYTIHFRGSDARKLVEMTKDDVCWPESDREDNAVSSVLRLEDGIYIRIGAIWQEKSPEIVYDLEVENDHSYTVNGFTVHNSLKGYDAFAVSHGFSFQPPLQSFTLLDSKRGITIRAPIFCED